MERKTDNVKAYLNKLIDFLICTCLLHGLGLISLSRELRFSKGSATKMKVLTLWISTNFRKRALQAAPVRSIMLLLPTHWLSSNMTTARRSQAASTSFPDSSPNDCNLNASKARKWSCHGCQCTCVVFPCCRTVAVESIDAVSSVTGRWEDVVSTWMACSLEEWLLAKVDSSDSVGSKPVSHSHAGDTFWVLDFFFWPFLVFISSRTGRKMAWLPWVQK